MFISQVIIRRHLPCIKNVCYQVQHMSTQTKSKPKTDLMSDFRQKLPSLRPKKPKREPFTKNFFLGKFDYEFLAFPEPQTPERYNEFQEWFNPIQEYAKSLNPQEFEANGSIPSHVIQKFRELGIFGARIPEDYNGMNLLNSEFLRVLEVVSTVPALGLFLLKQAVPAIDILKNYGSVEQKLKYLPKIAAGQSLASVAVTEKESGPGAEEIESVAVLSNNDDYWILEGEKILVPNADVADVFIVFAHAMQSGLLERRPETLACFIVDSDTEGVTISKDYTETIGAKGFNNGRITFKNVKIPKENLVGKINDGKKQLNELFVNTRHFVGALTIAILRNFSNQLTTEIMHKKHFDKSFHEIRSVHEIFSKLHCSIYMMESILYLTTSIMDIYEEPDTSMETALVEQFCVQECMTRIQDSMWLIGPKACTTSLPYERIFRDAFTVINYETSLLDTKIFNALSGIHHCGIVMADEIKKTRNPLHFPMFALKTLFSVTNIKTLKLHLEEYLHPSLRECAEYLDRCLFQVKDCAQEVLVQHGLHVSEKHGELQRLSDITSLAYVYVSILSRASRSYCIGNRDSESELKLCMILAYRLQKQIMALAEDIKSTEYANGDYYGSEIAKLNFERKEYFAAHPLQRNY